MNPALITLVGYGFVALLVLGMARLPRTWWAQECARRYGVRPSGPLGIWTRRDFLRRAALAAVGCPVLIALGVAAGSLETRYPGNRQIALISGAYLFGFGLLAAMAFAVVLESLWRAVFWRPRRPPRPLDPTACGDLATLLEALANGIPVPEGAWARVVLQPSSDRTFRTAQRAVVRLCAGERERYGRRLQRAAREWASELRALAT